jgi:hypothetical protein
MTSPEPSGLIPTFAREYIVKPVRDELHDQTRAILESELRDEAAALGMTLGIVRVKDLRIEPPTVFVTFWAAILSGP